ncbi:MAG TPA: GNAT family N-acetyltransferase, partial [Arenibaculum sp.]|nr:GNAT family N-acetyltransferase [Arenibaculum sp.]
ILRQAFAGNAARTDRYLDRLGRANVRVLRAGGSAVASLARQDFAHWVGGQPVPASGVAAVGTDPAARGRGIAGRLIRGLLSELHAEGRPLSSLYPATLPLYRNAGYALAGDQVIYRASLKAFARVEAPLGIERQAAPDRALLAGLRRREAASGNGLVERGDALWAEALEPIGGEVDVFVFHGGDGPEGYAAAHRAGPDALHFTDLCVPTANAARTAMALASGYRAQVDEVTWTGGPDDPLALLAYERGVRPERWRRWMMRVVNLPAALGARGWPAGRPGELVLAVRDPVLEANTGLWRLSVAEGRGEATRLPAGSRGAGLTLDIAALAALYTGYLAPARLAMLGLLEGEPEALAVATRLFAGPRPWSVDFY